MTEKSRSCASDVPKCEALCPPNLSKWAEEADRQWRRCPWAGRFRRDGYSCCGRHRRVRKVRWSTRRIDRDVIWL
jgi:hypothetical protein